MWTIDFVNDCRVFINYSLHKNLLRPQLATLCKCLVNKVQKINNSKFAKSFFYSALLTHNKENFPSFRCTYTSLALEILSVGGVKIML